MNVAGQIKIHPMWPVFSAWRGKWDAPRLAQCYDNMDECTAQRLIDAPSVEEAAEILGCTLDD